MYIAVWNQNKRNPGNDWRHEKNATGKRFQGTKDTRLWRSKPTENRNHQESLRVTIKNFDQKSRIKGWNRT
mgnify:CR=1 FL=1